MLIINYFIFILKNPLSRFPQGGKALLSAGAVEEVPFP
jgi:hypothetical protein